MTKPKKQAHDDSQIEEIDLSLIDLSAIDLTALQPSKPILMKEEKVKEFIQKRDRTEEEEDDIDPVIERDFDDAFDDDDFDEESDEESDEEEEDGDGKKKDSYKAPKDFLTDKRRQKTLKKFIDVTVPQEFLDGMTPDLQLLIKKGKAE